MVGPRWRSIRVDRRNWRSAAIGLDIVGSLTMLTRRSATTVILFGAIRSDTVGSFPTAIESVAGETRMLLDASQAAW